MNRSIMSVALGAMLGVAGPFFSMMTVDRADTQIESKVDALLSGLNQGADFELLTAQVATLTDLVAKSQQANAGEMESLRTLVATTTAALESERSAIEEMSQDFSDSLSKVTESIMEETEDPPAATNSLPAEGVGTLDVRDSAIEERPQSFSELVDAVLELKAAMAELQKRSPAASAAQSSTYTSYPASVASGVRSGGSCGTSVAGYSSQAYTSYASSGTQSVSYASPVVSYSAPMTSYPSVAVSTPAYAGTVRYSQSVVTPQRRTVLRRSPLSSANCTMVRGADGVYRQVCPVR